MEPLSETRTIGHFPHLSLGVNYYDSFVLHISTKQCKQNVVSTFGNFCVWQWDPRGHELPGILRHICTFYRDVPTSIALTLRIESSSKTWPFFLSKYGQQTLHLWFYTLRHRGLWSPAIKADKHYLIRKQLNDSPFGSNNFIYLPCPSGPVSIEGLKTSTARSRGIICVFCGRLFHRAAFTRTTGSHEYHVQ